MNINLITRHLPRNPGLVELAQRRAGYAFSRFGDLVREVEIRLSDSNGPRGGADVACLARVRLVSGGDLVVTGSASSPESGISQAVSRLAIRLGRLVARDHDHR